MQVHVHYSISFGKKKICKGGRRAKLVQFNLRGWGARLVTTPYYALSHLGWSWGRASPGSEIAI